MSDAAALLPGFGERGIATGEREIRRHPQSHVWHRIAPELARHATLITALHLAILSQARDGRRRRRRPFSRQEHPRAMMAAPIPFLTFP